MALRALPTSGNEHDGDGGSNVSAIPTSTDLLRVPYLERGVAIDVSVWGDEERMKKEIAAWAKAVVVYSVAVSSSEKRFDCR